MLLMGLLFPALLAFAPNAYAHALVPAAVARNSDAATATVHITGVGRPPGFSPDLLTVHTGDTIVFVNDAAPAAPYTIVADDHSFASPTIAPGQQWRLTFSKTGQYEYHDPAHAALMVGEIVVDPAAIALLPTPDPAAKATAIAQLTSHHQKTPSGGLTFSLPLLGSLPQLVVLGVFSGLALLILLLLIIVRSRRKRRQQRAQPVIVPASPPPAAAPTPVPVAAVVPATPPDASTAAASAVSAEPDVSVWPGVPLATPTMAETADLPVAPQPESQLPAEPDSQPFTLPVPPGAEYGAAPDDMPGAGVGAAPEEGQASGSSKGGEQS